MREAAYANLIPFLRHIDELRVEHSDGTVARSTGYFEDRSSHDRRVRRRTCRSRRAFDMSSEA